MSVDRASVRSSTRAEGVFSLRVIYNKLPLTVKKIILLVLPVAPLILMVGMMYGQDPVPNPPQRTNDSVMATMGELTQTAFELRQYQQTLIQRIKELNTELFQKDAEIRSLKERLAKYETPNLAPGASAPHH